MIPRITNYGKDKRRERMALYFYLAGSICLTIGTLIMIFKGA